MKTLDVEPVWFDRLVPSEALLRGWDTDVMIVELPAPGVTPPPVMAEAKVSGIATDVAKPKARRKRAPRRKKRSE